MLNIKHVTAMPQVLSPKTIYLLQDRDNNLIIVVTGASGEVVRKTISMDELEARVNSLFPATWNSVQFSQGPDWGATIYVLQTYKTLWRIKRVDASGVIQYALSQDFGNEAYTPTTAFEARTALTYH